MKFQVALCLAAALFLGLLPAASFAQDVDINVTHSILPDQPYTLIYPAVMQPSGGGDQPLVINHPKAPLQCGMTIVPTEQTTWSADEALADLDDDAATQSWAETFPGFTLGDKGTTPYQNVTALTYQGTSTNSPQGVPITLVHTEAVDNGNGYVLDCFFATEVARQARPVVDFIIANFSTDVDAECCVPVEASTTEPSSTGE